MNEELKAKIARACDMGLHIKIRTWPDDIQSGPCLAIYARMDKDSYQSGDLLGCARLDHRSEIDQFIAKRVQQASLKPVVEGSKVNLVDDISMVLRQCQAVEADGRLMHPEFFAQSITMLRENIQRLHERALLATQKGLSS